MQKIKSINYTASAGNMILLGDADRETFKFETAQFKWDIRYNETRKTKLGSSN